MTAAEAVGEPTIEGPVPGVPVGGPRTDVAGAGYLVEEYWMDGVAVAYDDAVGARPDVGGMWQAVEVASAAYRTRLLVLRPQDPARFNGTVLLNWQNVSAGAEPLAPRLGEVLQGYAWVGVSAQEAGLYGRPAAGAAYQGGRRPLIEADPRRYGTLRHPGDQGSFDIFSDAARVVGPRRSTAVDPLAGLAVVRVVAVGSSQSAMRLAAYLNAVHPRHRVVDAFLLTVWEGKAPRLTDGVIAGPLRTGLRTDTGCPVMVVNSEFEALPLRAARVVDTPGLRVWEVAGAPHAPAVGSPARSGWGPNPLDFRVVVDAAVRAVHRWAAGGPAAPAQHPLEVEPPGAGPPQLRRDERGLAVGGVRLPEMEAPTGEYRGIMFGTGRAPLFGGYRRWADPVLQSLYPDRAAYRSRWCAAVDEMVGSGTLRPEDAEAQKARHAEVQLPL